MVNLSIIVPIYGVEQYLRKCVDSLLNQDFPSSEYEIILVDDGGHDNCPQICDEYAQRVNSEEGRANSIRVIHRENGGLSAARNSGIEIARGEYVMFVDSDDYIEPNVLGMLMEQIERDNLDVLRFDYRNVNENYEVFEPNKAPHKVDTCSKIVDGETYLNTRMGYACYAVMYIIKRRLLIDDRCLFTEGIHFEDVDWLPRMMLRAKRVNSTTKVVYNYLLRQGSITQTQGDKVKILKNIEDEMYIIEQYKKYCEAYPNCQWLKNMQSSMATGVLTVIARNFFEEREVYISRLKKMHVFPLSIKDQGKTYNRRARLINILGANAYCLLMHLRACV